jgi:ATP-dependent helicase/nuclease subunit B
MEALDDEKSGPDALDFGILIHEAFRALAADPELGACVDAEVLADALAREADRWVSDRFGKTPPLPVTIAADAARQRLAAAARIQAGLARDGWTIVSAEQAYETELGGVRVRGTVDRIDRHRESGRLRLIDYKTSDQAVQPEKAHLAPARPETPAFASVTVRGKARQWIDLQLPLYRILLEAGGDPGVPVETGYFNLPKAVSETGFTPWIDFTADILDSARVCAEGVIERVRGRVFWPPAPSVLYESFENLFPGNGEQWFDPPRLNRGPEP